MGERGAIPRARIPQRSRKPSVHPETPPRCPPGLGREAKEIWKLCWQCEWVHESDAPTVLHLAKLVDEQQLLAMAIDEDGDVYWEPIQNARGDELGKRLVAHPGIRALRELDRSVLAVRGALGLSPEGRGRIGLDLIARSEAPNQLDEINERRKRRLAKRVDRHSSKTHIVSGSGGRL
jgi:hypothetical protein